MDPVSLIAIISASSALIVAILTHIKYSKCCGFVLRTTEGTESSPITPSLTTPLINQSSQISSQIPSSVTQPIDIPSKPILTRQNYL
jgi:hypothetical protein